MYQDNLTNKPKEWCKEQKLLEGVSTIMISFKEKIFLFPSCVLGIAVGTVLEVCRGGNKILCKFRGFAKYQLFSDVSPD